MNYRATYLQILRMKAQFFLQLGSSGGGLPSGRSAVHSAERSRFLGGIIDRLTIAPVDLRADLPTNKSIAPRSREHAPQPADSLQLRPSTGLA